MQNRTFHSDGINIYTEPNYSQIQPQNCPNNLQLSQDHQRNIYDITDRTVANNQSVCPCMQNYSNLDYLQGSNQNNIGNFNIRQNQQQIPLQYQMPYSPTFTPQVFSTPQQISQSQNFLTPPQTYRQIPNYQQQNLFNQSAQNFQQNQNNQSQYYEQPQAYQQNMQNISQTPGCCLTFPQQLVQNSNGGSNSPIFGTQNNSLCRNPCLQYDLLQQQNILKHIAKQKLELLLLQDVIEKSPFTYQFHYDSDTQTSPEKEERSTVTVCTCKDESLNTELLTINTSPRKALNPTKQEQSMSKVRSLNLTKTNDLCKTPNMNCFMEKYLEDHRNEETSTESSDLLVYATAVSVQAKPQINNSGSQCDIVNGDYEYLESMLQELVESAKILETSDLEIDDELCKDCNICTEKGEENSSNEADNRNEKNDKQSLSKDKKVYFSEDY